MKEKILCFLCLACFGHAMGQSSLVPLSPDTYHQIDRLVILHPADTLGFQGVTKPYSRRQVSTLLRNTAPTSFSAKANWQFLAHDTWDSMDTLVDVARSPIAKYFFSNRTDLYSVNSDHFDVHVNPVVYLGGGLSPSDTARLFRNTRGVEVRGTIDKKVSFYTIMADNQARWAPYIQRSIDSLLVVPGQGFWKPFRETGVDFLLARGHVNVPVTKHIELTFGHDRQFIGHGHRSMIWSDYSPPHLFFRADTRIWKVRYTNLFTQMIATPTITPQGTITDTYATKQVTLHHLTVNLTPTFQGSVFELVVNGDADSLGTRFGINYLNPIIFYRYLEQQGGSSGNALLGADFKWDLWRHLRLYGQFVMDEFQIVEVRARRGWWGNKYGAQLGLKYINAFGADGLDVQLEANWARPYTYTHLSNFTSVTNFLQPLAHPLGANFQEGIAILRYQPLPKWQFTLKAIGARYGTDTLGSNWGTNLRLPYSTRVRNYGNTMLQGVPVTWGMGELRANYMLWHQCFVELVAMGRYLQVGTNDPTLEYYASLQLRWSIPYRNQDF